MDPFKQIATILDQRVAGRAGAGLLTVSAELGTVTATGLKLDNFKYEITDYLVAEHLRLSANYMSATDVAGTHPHLHNVTTPNELRPLTTGDRVLAIPVSGGQDYVVVARVVG